MNKDVIYPSMVIRTQEETINKLEDEVNKQAKAIQIYEKELKKHDNNWTELKEWLKQETIDLYNKDNPMLLDSSFTKYVTERKMAYMYILDKIKELEENK